MNIPAGEWVSLANLAATIAGLAGIGSVGLYRLARIEKDMDRAHQEREKAFELLASTLGQINATIATKSEDAAREHQEFRGGITAASLRLDDQRGRMDDHGRRLDDHDHRIVKIESVCREA